MIKKKRKQLQTTKITYKGNNIAEIFHPFHDPDDDLGYDPSKYYIGKNHFLDIVLPDGYHLVEFNTHKESKSYLFENINNWAHEFKQTTGN